MRKEKIYVKAFKLSNQTGEFTNEDFENFKEKLEIIRKLYMKSELGMDCYPNFRSITKEVKRAAHNAGLDYELLDLGYESTLTEAIIHGEYLNEINVLVFIKPIRELKPEFFSILQVQKIDINTDENFVTVKPIKNNDKVLSYANKED